MNLYFKINTISASSGRAEMKVSHARNVLNELYAYQITNNNIDILLHAYILLPSWDVN